MNNFNLNANSFYAYMRTLAAQHREIGVDNQEDNRKHFFVGELEDFYKGLCSVVKFPALVVEGFQINLSDNEQDTVYRESAFVVVFSYNDHQNTDQETDCYSKSEDVGREILRRMAYDGDDAICPIRISNIQGVQVLNETNKYAGIRFSFTLSNANVTEINTKVWQ